MANYYHGVSTRQVDTSVSTPVEADSGIAFVVGAAPVHTVGGPVNEPVMCYTYQEAVSAFGFSDDWEKYPLCEMIYSQFQLYGVAPVVLVNVLDPEKHKKPVAEQNYPVTDGKAYLPLEAIQASVTVKNNAAAEGEPGNYTAGTDYDTLYDGENDILYCSSESVETPTNACRFEIHFGIRNTINGKNFDGPGNRTGARICGKNQFVFFARLKNLHVCFPLLLLGGRREPPPAGFFQAGTVETSSRKVASRTFCRVVAFCFTPCSSVARTPAGARESP